ncbi:IS481 family transposase [Streptomyces pseudogriseolus]|uniref:IS481 family transposase n=1 Tax=Streptomyces pseudogriseolus TaxID=36817 RepID=UPI003FA2669D|nr:IS481 family transposase [Streptomyces pseudogriseolus]
MSHRNAPLPPTGRLRLARCVVDEGRPLRRAAERFQVSHTTAARWASRYRQLGEAGMHDRSSRPHHSPRQTPAPVEQQVVRLRSEHRFGPVRLAARCGIAASTAHRILVRHHLPALATLDRATGEPVRRYGRARPGELVHIDVRKLGRIPDPGGHKVLGRAAGRANQDRRHGAGYAYLHTALDDHSRLAYTEDPPDEEADTCAGFLTRAVAWFAARGVTVERVLTDNAWAYTTNAWRQTCHELNISPRRARPWRPQTNGKVERFPRTLLDEWAYHRPYTSDAERQAAFPDWLDWYHYHRPHTGIDGHPPASRVTQLSEQHT